MDNIEAVGPVGTITMSQGGIGSSMLSGCSVQVSIEHLPLADLKLALAIPSPKIVVAPPPSIDQMVASAQSRLTVGINAECDWLSKQVAREFADLREDTDFRFRCLWITILAERVVYQLTYRDDRPNLWSS